MAALCDSCKELLNVWGDTADSCPMELYIGMMGICEGSVGTERWVSDELPDPEIQFISMYQHFSFDEKRLHKPELDSTLQITVSLASVVFYFILNNHTSHNSDSVNHQTW